MKRTFGQAQRDEFTALARTAPLDERRAADEAQRLASSWVAALPAVLDVDLARCLFNKVAGYNADLHQHARRALRAIAAADSWLCDSSLGRHIEFDLDDLLLSEYFLAQRLRTKGGTFTTRVPWDKLVANLLLRHPPRCASADYEPVEAPILPPEQPILTPRTPLPVLFVATMNSYLGPMIPVMERMVRDGRRVGILLPAESQTWPNARHLPAWVERISFDALLEPDLADMLESESRRWSVAWNDRERDVSCRFVLEGIDLWPFIARDIAHMARVYIPHTLIYAEIAHRFCERRNVRVVVCARLRRAAECAFVHAAQARGARCVMIVHGHISGRPERRFDDGAFDRADAVCVWGRHQRDLLIDKKENIDPGRIAVTGNPDWDRLATTSRTPEHRATVRAAAANALGVDPRSVLVTLVSQRESRSQFEAVARAVLDDDRTSLLVRVHPREDAATYLAAIAERLHPRVRIIKDAPPSHHDLLLAGDVTVTLHATANIESLLLGTPVITAALGDLASIDRPVHLERFGLPLCTTEAQLRTLIAQIAEDTEAFRASQRLAVERALADVVANHDPAVNATLGVALLIRNLESEAA